MVGRPLKPWAVCARRTVGLLAVVVACAQAPPEAGDRRAAPAVTAEQLRLEVVARHPHDRQAFTQGLLWHAGYLYESTGLYGASEVRRVDVDSGRVDARQRLDASLFGEGLARVGERLVQLSWQAGIATVYDLESLSPLEQWSYSGEGWGLAYDPAGDRLVRSDGSHRLTFHDTSTFAVVGGLDVHLEGRPLRNLNELEVVGGDVWANVWQQERLVRIDLASGAVTAVVDARGLLAASERSGTDVMNGIAYDEDAELFYVTGKLWPALFAVRFVAEPSPASGP